MDSVILNLVDVFLDVGGILNEVPSTVVELIGGSVDAAGISGREMHLLMTDTWLASRNPFPLGDFSMQIGSSDHVTSTGNHVLLSRDRDLGMMQTDEGLVDPLVPIAASVNFSGLQAFSLVDSNSTDSQVLTLKTVSAESLRLAYVSHKSASLDGSEYQSAWLSDVPDDITITASPSGVDYSASSEIGSIVYTGYDGSLSQAVRVTGFPDSFSTTSGSVLSWSSNSTIDLIEAQISDSPEPQSMVGDHFLFHHDPQSNTSSLSATLTGISEVGWIPPVEEGAPGPDGIGTAFATIEGRNSMKINVANAPSSEKLPLSILAEIDPLPSSLSLQIPSGSDSGPSLDVPEFNSSQGMTGVAFFIGGLSDLGRSVNGVLSGITTDISTGSSSGTGTSPSPSAWRRTPTSTW